MSTRDDLRRELSEAYRKFELADQAGDVESATQFKQYGTELENRINSLRAESNEPEWDFDTGTAVQSRRQSALAEPDLADPPEVQQQKLDEARPALEGIEKTAKEIDQVSGVQPADYAKGAYSDMLRIGAGFFEEWSTEARLHQQDRLDELDSLMGDDADPERMAALRAKVESGEEISPTVYNTWIKPFFTKDGVPPEQRLRAAQEAMLKSRSPAAQKKSEKPFFRDDPESLRKFNAAEPSTWFDETSMPWEDPEAFALALSQNSVSLAASIVSARVGGKAGAMAKGRQLRASGVSNPKIVRELAAKTGTKVGTLAGVGTEYVLVRDATQMGLQDALKGHWDKDDLWAENPRYTELTEAGYSPEYAKQVVTDEIARMGGTVAGVSSSLLGAPMSHFWAKLGLEKAASRAGSTIKGAVGESLQEGVQETVETLTANIAESTLDPSKPWTADLGNAFFGGAAMGGAMGGTMGALSGGDSQVALNKDQKDLNKLGFKEWRDTQNERSKLQAKTRDPEYMNTTSPEQRIRDFNELEELEYREAKAYKRSENKIRRMQRKYGIKANEKRRTEIFSERYAQSIENIELARKSRIGAEEQVESTRQQMAERDEMIRQVNEDNVELADLEITKTDLDTLAEGGLVEDTESLIEQGYARWTSKAQTKMVLTPAGRNARRSIGDAVARLHEKIDSGYAGEDRRSEEGAERRKRLDEMSPEEKDAELRTDELTRIPNRRAYNEDEAAEPAGAYASVDADSLKWINDNMGGEAKGDELLRKIARAGRTEKANIYRTGGDEFVVRGDSVEEVEAVMQRIAARLASYEPISDEAGNTTQPTITWFTEEDFTEADLGMKDMKGQREEAGIRGARGEVPPNLIDPTAPTQFGLFSYNSPVSAVQDIVNQIKKVRSNTDEFSQRRVRKLSQQMADLKERTESMEVARAVEGLMEELDTPSDTELARDWETLGEAAQQRYDLAASEFYTPYTGELVSGLEVYQHEHGSQILASKLPSAENNDFGDPSIYEASQEFAQIREFVKQNRMSPELRRSLQRDAQRLGELMQNEEDGMAYALSLRVAGYLGGEYAARGPNPFSANAADFDAIHEDYTSSVLPLLLWATDPVMTQGFYRPLGKGDRVEVIVNGEGVEGIVASTGQDSIVVRWDSKGPQLYDPDTGATGNSARFSTKYGWQSSAKAARAGTSYKSQGLSWPGQARLGRRFNKQSKKWEDAKQSDKSLRQIRKRTSATAPRSAAIARASRAKATPAQLNSARRVAGQLLAGYSNLPTVNIANTVADLPAHMQDKLVSHGYSGDGVMGMFDELEPANGVWVLAGNIAAKSKAEDVPFETLFAEAVAHETIGHYGLRGFMGDEVRMDRWMDALARSKAKIGEAGTVRDAVLQTGIQRGLVHFDYRGGHQYRSEEARRLAAEETIAEIAQRIIQQTPGYQLSEQKRGIIQRIADHLRVWLIDHGFGRFVRLGDQDIYRMIWQAQNFASNGRGWEYRARTGRTLTPFMRDADIFRAQVLTHFYDGMRKTNGAERKQMKADGLAPLNEVPFFPKEAKITQWKQLFAKSVSDGHVKASEYAMTQMDDYLDSLTWAKIYVDSGVDHLPDRMAARVRELEAVVNFDGAKAANRMEALRQQALNADALRISVGSLMGMDFGDIAVGLKKQREKEMFEFPSVEETEGAKAELTELLGTPMGKKTKIPFRVVAQQLERKAVKVTVRPAGGYTGGQNYDVDAPKDQLLDIHPGNWQEVRPTRTGSYSDYVPTGTDPDQFGVYVFYQENPVYKGEIDHSSFAIDEGYSGSFMHMRYAMGETLDGNKSYDILELQSDNFQKKDKAQSSSAEREVLMQRRDTAERVMNAGVQGMREAYGAALKTQIQVAYLNMIESDEDWREGTSHPTDQAVYDELSKVYGPIRSEIGQFRSETQRQIAAMGPLTHDDARVMEYLDLKALDAAADHFVNKIHRAEERVYNPSNPDQDFTRSWEQFVDAWKGDPSDVLERVVARPRLLERFLNGVLTPVTGRTYDMEEVSAMQKEFGGKLRRETVIVPAELVKEMQYKYGEYVMGDVVSAFESEFKALGWGQGVLQIGNVTDGIDFTGWTKSAETSLEVAVRAAMHKYASSRGTAEWERSELKRVNEVKQQIRNMEQTGAEISSQEDLDRARSEIEFGEDHGIDPDVRYIDRDTYAEQKTDHEIESNRNNGTLRTLADEYNVNYSEFEYDGHTLDRDHPEYRSRIAVDDDGDADTSEAEDWLSDRQSDELDDLFDDGERGYSRIHDYYINQFDDRYENTRVREFAVPVEWDEDGDVTGTEDGYIVSNQEDDDGDVDGTYEIHWDNDVDYHNYNEEDALNQLNSLIFNYYENEGITPPTDSVFHVRMTRDVPQELRDQLQPKPRPNPGTVARNIQEAEIKSDIKTSGDISLDKAFDDRIMVARALDQGTIEGSPLRDVWQPVGLKFVIADAIRKGAESITWQGGDASTSRGGIGAEWTQTDHLDFVKKTMSIGGVDKEVFVIKSPDISDLVMDPSRMAVVLGPRVTREIIRQSNDTDPDLPAKRARERFRIVPVGERFALFDNTNEEVLGFKDTALTAETMRADVVKKNMETGGDAALPSGRVTANDMGGRINILDQAPVPDYYVHTIVPGQRIRGARTSYDVMIPSHIKKLIKPYGGEVIEGVKKIPKDQIATAISKDGAHASYQVSKDFQAEYPNLKVEAIGNYGYVVVSDLGMAVDTVYPTQQQARDSLEGLLGDAQAQVDGIFVYEVKITDEMRKEFGGGSLPILSVDNKREHYTQYNADKDPTLWTMPERIEGVRKKRAGTTAGLGGEINEFVRETGLNFSELARQIANMHRELGLQLSTKNYKGIADKLRDVTQGYRVNITPTELQAINEVMRRLRGRLTVPPLFARDPISGNPILEAMAQKVGQVPLQKTLNQRFDHWRKGWAARVNQGVFDKFYGIKNAMKQTHWQGTAEEDPYMSARLTTSLDSQMRAVMSYGHPVWEDGIMKVEGKGLLEILAPVGKPENLRAWSLFMVARRAQRLKAEGREQLITDEEIAEGLALGARHPVFQQVADEYAEFNKAVLDFAEESGVIDPETRPLWEHADYVPFYRVMDERVVGPLSTTTGIANQRKPIKQLKGGEAALSDIPTNIIQNVTNLIESSNKNQAALLAVNALNNTGVMSKIPPLKAEQALVPMSQVKQALVTAGLDPDQIPPSALQGMQKMFIMKPPSGEGVISVLRAGKREYYQTDDRVLWEAMTMINQKQFGRWMNLFRGPKRFLTAAVTLDPGFMLANYVRDLASSFVQSRDTNNPLTHIVRSAQGWKQAVMKDESIRTMMSAGAAFDSGYMNYGDPNSTTRAIRKAQRSQGFRKTIIGDTARSVFDFYKEFGASFENANRIAVYNEALANGKSVKQAAFEAKDLMDFSMGGSYPVVQFLIQSVPFMGARMQGLHRLGRGFADNPVAFTLKGLMLTMAGMALWFNYKDDERYKKLEEWDKDTYFHWWIGDRHFRLPKPFEVGVIFNTWPERAVEYYYNESPDAEKLLLERFMFSIAETFALNPTMQTVKPAFESAFNYNFFTGRQIVDPYTEKRMPPEQFRPSTSPTMIEIARALPSGLDKASPKFRSPLHLENMYRGYMGTLGRYALMASDELVRETMDYPAKPTMQPADYPVSGRFYRGTDDDPRRTKYEEGYYDILRKTEEIQGSLKFLDKIGNANRMAFIEAEQEPIIALSKDVDKTRREITQLNKDMFDVWMDEELSPDEKRKQADEIQEAKNAEYKAIHDLRQEQSKEMTADDITYMLEKYGVDEVVTRIEKSSPATASLMQDIRELPEGALPR